MKDDVLVYPAFIKEDKGIVFFCVPDLNIRNRAASVPGAIMKARKLIGAALTVFSIGQPKYPLPSNAEKARALACENSRVDYSDALAVLIDVDPVLYWDADRQVERVCALPYRLDRKIEERKIDCSFLLKDAVEKHLHDLHIADKAAELIGETVEIETKRAVYYGEIVGLRRKKEDGAPCDGVKIDIGSGVIKTLALSKIQTISATELWFDRTGVYHLEQTGDFLSFKSAMSWFGDPVDVYLDYFPDSDSIERSLEAMHIFYENLYEWDQRLKFFAASALAGDRGKIPLEQNLDTQITGLKFISKEEFARRMKCTFINVSANGDIYFDFSFDGRIFSQVIQMKANVYSKVIFELNFLPKTDEDDAFDENDEDDD